ncbi:MAG TPA: GxxExxY protein [Phycisphaerales bacterium]|nr:GxxExxY protein [Phycisphaerales bacterium]
MEGAFEQEDPLTREIIGGAIEVHRVLGPGLLESAYEECLASELSDRGLQVQRQIGVPVVYKGRRLELGYRLDLLVNESVIVELKTVDKVLPVHEAQLMSYLKLMNKRVGLLLNFHVPVLKDGIVRRVR